MWWPLWIALTSAGALLTWRTDRTAFVGFLAVLGGLIAMQIPFGIPRFFPALTIWAIVAAIIVISSNSILAGILAVLVALCYLPAVVGAPWLYSARASDVCGVALLLVLAGPTILGWAGLADHRLSRFVHSGPLPAWPMAALSHVAGTQKKASTEALERDL